MNVSLNQCGGISLTANRRPRVVGHSLSKTKAQHGGLRGFCRDHGRDARASGVEIPERTTDNAAQKRMHRYRRLVQPLPNVFTGRRWLGHGLVDDLHRGSDRPNDDTRPSPTVNAGGEGKDVDAHARPSLREDARGRTRERIIDDWTRAAQS
jgi:hypothetical protein